MPVRIWLASRPPPMASKASVAPVAFSASISSAMKPADVELQTWTAPAARSIASWSGFRTMFTSGICCSMQSRLSIWPRLEAAAVCTSALCFSIRMVSTMPSTVIGFTNEAAPSIAVTPAGSSRHSATLTDRYWEYIPPPAAATTLPSRALAAADPPAATTVPAPSLPTGMGVPTRPARPRMATSGMGAVTTGRSADPLATAAANCALTTPLRSGRRRPAQFCPRARRRPSRSDGDHRVG